jgi:hypothetical protein
VSGRRLLALVVVLAAIGIPAGVLQAACVGRSCDAGPVEAARVPFCPLPGSLKSLIVNGYREGRSPDVLGVVDRRVVATALEGSSRRVPWPSTGGLVDSRVPIAFVGAGVTAGASIPDGTTLDAVAPTIADALAFARPFPDVRSGTAIDGVASGAPPSLIVLVAWKGIGTADLEAEPDAWPFLASMLDRGAGTLDASTGSVPLDPAATLTTIGTGGLPSQHGITGSFVRNDDGEVTPAFGEGSPVPVIASFADDLDAPDATGVASPFGQRPDVALVETSAADRGLIGIGWYEGTDDDATVEATRGDAVASVRSLLASMTLNDDAPDVLGVVLDGSLRSMDRRTRAIVEAVEAATRSGALIALAATGAAVGAGTGGSDDVLVASIQDAVPGERSIVAATVAGGVFLDRAALTAAAVTGQVAVDALLEVTDADGRDMMADAFQGFAVSFARYC